MGFVIAVFKYKDWEFLTEDGVVQRFDTEQLAEQFVEDYPQWGSDWGKAIRTGNWQIVEDSSNTNNSSTVN